jgi:cell division protein FtsI/penicillin-binding protein 2
MTALAAGLVVGSVTEGGSDRVAQDFARAWDRGDYREMHDLLSTGSGRRYPLRAFRATYENAVSVSTASNVVVGRPRGASGGNFRLPVKIRTRVFGTIEGEVVLPVGEEAVEWSPSLAFPGLEEGVTLTRRTEVPRRASILSVDGKVIAEGPDGTRSSPIGEVGSSIAGQMAESEDAAERRALYARGFASDTLVGATGLERAFQRRLEGKPGGTLRAGARTVASSKPVPAKAVRSTIDTRIQQAAVTALAGRLGGIAAIDTRSGQVRALAGIAFSAPQPPGSVFKIVTTAAALEEKKVKLSDKFPVESRALIDGVTLENANGELCGGTFAQSFAHSCNSVFAPLGVKVGSKKLVETAERFGWNEKPRLPGEKASTLPDSGEIVSPLEIGSTAIGQFKVLATPLQMASVAQVIGNDGKRLAPTLEPGTRPQPERVISAKIASTIEDLMIGVVGFGTGTAAAIPGVKVAGKTGTAELEDTRGPEVDENAPKDPNNTDAWFTSFAPAGKPKIAVAALFVRNGSGGAIAAPAARAVLIAALQP